MIENELVKPGWYPDPQRTAHSRWWDGESWTDNVRNPSLSKKRRLFFSFLAVLLISPAINILWTVYGFYLESKNSAVVEAWFPIVATLGIFVVPMCFVPAFFAWKIGRKPVLDTSAPAN